MKAILGRKIGMSQLFSSDGVLVPVTLILAQANTITLRRTVERDGYSAIQLTLPKNAKKKESVGKKTTKKMASHAFEAQREVALEVGDDVTSVGVDQFEVGDVVQVVGRSKGKGFQGVVKRHGFKGGPASHGHRHVLRSGGSIGSAYPQHVVKGKKMAGRMGFDRVTVKNLTVAWIDVEKDLLGIKGAVPGAKGSVVMIESVSSSVEKK